MNELEKRAKYHRKKQAGLSPFCSLGESLTNSLITYNGTNISDLDYKSIDLSNSNEIGIHCGTEVACKQLGYKYVNKLSIDSPTILELNFDMDGMCSSPHLIRYLQSNNLFQEDEIETLMKNIREVSGDIDKYKKYSSIFRNFFIDKGYNVISYPNEIEDGGSTSYIILDVTIINKIMNEAAHKIDRKSIDKNRIDIARLLGIPSEGIIVSENGRIEIHNIPEDDARRYSNILRNKVKDIRLIPGKYDFRKVPMPGQVPGRLATISGMLKDNLNEEMLNEMKEFRDYKGYEMRADYDVDPEDGTMSLVVHLYKDGKEVQQDAYGRELSFENYRKAREWIDKNTHKCSAIEKLNQLDKILYLKYGNSIVHGLADDYDNVLFEYHNDDSLYYRAIYLDNNFNWRIVIPEFDNIQEAVDSSKEFRIWLDKQFNTNYTEYDLELDGSGDSWLGHLSTPVLHTINYILVHELSEGGCPLYIVGKGLDSLVDALPFLDTDELENMVRDEYDCSIPESLTEARKKRKKKRLGGTLNPDAGNVEVYTKMFNKMNSPIDGPTNNPISGPFGGDVAASNGSSDVAADAGASSGMGESLEKKSPEMIEFEYKDIVVTVYGEKRDVDDWDEWEVTTDWSYKVPKQDVEEVLLCDFMTEEDLPGINDMESEEQYKFVRENFDELFAKYEDKLTEHYYEDACEDAQERYEYEPYYPEYDSYDIWEDLHRPITKNSVLDEGMADDNFDLFLRGM